jgi:hypothetical protein
VTRLLRGAAVALLALALFVPAVLAASLPHNGRVLISTGGDVAIPAGEHADVVVVVNGTATIEGEVNTIVAIDGAATLAGARTETVVAVRSPVELGPDTVVLGDVMALDAAVHQTGNAVIQGSVTDLATVLIGIGAVLAPALMLLWIGMGLATVIAGLLVAGLASRQVRDAELLISREPVQTIGIGILGVIAVPVVAFVLIATVIGAPLGVGILFAILPLAAFVGYIVGAIWIGEWVLAQTSSRQVHEKPYLAAVIGVLVLAAVAIVPILGIVSVIASLFGFGAVIRLASRALRSPTTTPPMPVGPVSAPSPS